MDFPIGISMYRGFYFAMFDETRGYLVADRSGFQSDPSYENWPGWPFLELGFACLLIFEVLRRMHWCHG